MSRPSKRSARDGIRLQKYLSACGHCSRRHAELLIQAGLVLVDGEPAELGSKVVPERQVVTINGDRIVSVAVSVLALHKPAGFITAEHDTHDRLTVMDLLPRRFVLAGVSPVGRLDLETTGLLIMTNDGDLAHRIAHPSFTCKKRYRAEVQGLPNPEACERLRRGLRLEDGPTAPAEVELTERRRGSAVLELVLTEGRKRQVRRMCDAIGHPVKLLARMAVGGVELGDLPVGKWRELTPAEVRTL